MEHAGLNVVKQINKSLSSFTSYVHRFIWDPLPDQSGRAANAFSFATGILSYSYANYSQGSGRMDFVGKTPVITGRTKLMWPWNKSQSIDQTIDTIRNLP